METNPQNFAHYGGKKFLISNFSIKFSPIENVLASRRFIISLVATRFILQGPHKSRIYNAIWSGR